MSSARTATVVLIVSIVLAAIGTVLAIMSLDESGDPGLATALAAGLVPVATALFLVGAVLKVRARRHTG